MGIYDLDDVRAAARRRLPRLAFDFVDGAAGRESSSRRSEAAFADILLVPRVLAGAEIRSTEAELFGTAYAAPIGIPPIGLAGLSWPGTDAALARAAGKARIPYILSTAATTSIEEIAQANPDAWFQIYVGKDQHIVDDLLDRAEGAGLKTLVVTVDVPAPGKRVRDLRNGFTLPLRLTARSVVNLVMHPRWCLSVLRHGAPRFANLERYAEEGSSTQSLAALMAGQSSARLNWELLAAIRQRWPGRLIVKGVLNPEDALRLRQVGADGIVVSNHGGRQLDAAPAPVSMLPAIRAAVGADYPVMIDGGIRSGEDIAKSISRGADFVFVGRPFVFSVAACGPEKGPALVIRTLTQELDNVLAQLGVTGIEALKPSSLAECS
jgi:L-lactate dehydrogenase (cytochrome)